MNRRRFLIAIALVAALAALLLLAAAALAAVPDPSVGGRPITAWNQQAAAGSWASPWFPIAPGQTITLTHNLGGNPEDYSVQFWFYDQDGTLGIHTRGYGGVEDAGAYEGAAWQRLTATTIQVYRYPDDTAVDRVRVWLWVASTAQQWCSNWVNIGRGAGWTFDHSLGGDVDDLVVGLWFKQTAGHDGQAPLGINHRGFGGLEEDGSKSGADWRNLTHTSINVYRNSIDDYADLQRVCVSRPAEAPDYDSLWQNITPGTPLTLNHDLGGNPGHYVVRVEFQDVGPFGIHAIGMGGDAYQDGTDHGVHWQNLTNSSISVYRWADDTDADQVRVRIWQQTFSVYLPTLQRSYP